MQQRLAHADQRYRELLAAYRARQAEKEPAPRLPPGEETAGGNAGDALEACAWEKRDK